MYAENSVSLFATHILSIFIIITGFTGVIHFLYLMTIHNAEMNWCSVKQLIYEKRRSQIAVSILTNLHGNPSDNLRVSVTSLVTVADISRNELSVSLYETQ